MQSLSRKLACAASALFLAVALGACRPAEATKTYVLTVEGMSCDVACPPAVKEALAAIPGVTDVDVDFETKRATVTVSGDTELTQAGCDQAFGNSGYFVDEISESGTDAGS